MMLAARLTATDKNELAVIDNFGGFINICYNW